LLCEFLAEGLVFEDQHALLSLLFLAHHADFALAVARLGGDLLVFAEEAAADGFVLDEADQETSGVAQFLAGIAFLAADVNGDFNGIEEVAAFAFAGTGFECGRTSFSLRLSSRRTARWTA
jgi:hypothetical protein